MYEDNYLVMLWMANSLLDPFSANESYFLNFRSQLGRHFLLEFSTNPFIPISSILSISILLSRIISVYDLFFTYPPNLCLGATFYFEISILFIFNIFSYFSLLISCFTFCSFLFAGRWQCMYFPITKNKNVQKFSIDIKSKVNLKYKWKILVYILMDY